MSLRIVFLGTPEFATTSLNALLQSNHEVIGVVTAPDKPAGRGQQLNESDVKKFAVQHELKLFQPEKLRDEHFIQELKNLNADLFVVVAFRMLPEVVWNMPRLGTLNLHEGQKVSIHPCGKDNVTRRIHFEFSNNENRIAKWGVDSEQCLQSEE